ncbi:hypothetical protein [Scleromatobacter humisilvae]|uniref:Uncharacterized protein n=1 Tax=Scleromatobacter humisilvae TaxID=2897159 RepID=A0A9X1YIJ0_9BURK|nr:hypothetical protein [Scleromatobacter humisilvae]MCK9686055.1 hypothetical protein [Scleromatobacter humisilvae]
MSRYQPNEPARVRRAELVERIERFVDGTDVSVESAGLIEAGLDDAFPDDDWMSERVRMLASYRPGGGDSLYDEAQMRAELTRVLERLRRT